jgi:hypothetical protein
MAITPNFTNDDIKRVIVEKMKRIEEVILLRLQRIGEQFITDARLNGTYTDRTGNLRSSIGYVILRNGEQYSQGGFQKVSGVTKLSRKAKKQLSDFSESKTLAILNESLIVDGTRVGKSVLAEAIGRFPTGLVLIVVAGMSYAAAVESKGRDVLTGSSQIAVISLKKAMDAISKKVA